jgi:hypothetical protein
MYKKTNEEPVQKMYQAAITLAGLSVFPLLFGVQHVFNIFYASLNKRQFNPYAPINMLDTLIFFLFFTIILNTYAYNMSGTWNERLPKDERAFVYCRNMTDEAVNESVIWTLGIILLWLRVFFLLRYNEYLGKFIIVVQRVIPDIALFFVFYLLQLALFALLAEGYFRTLPSYNTFWNAFTTLFYASLGTFDFEELYDAEFGQYFALFFMILFLVINIGVVMNLFVAVIAVLYDEFSAEKNVYQMLETLKIRSYTQVEKKYSALVSLPVPLNFLLLIVSPFLMLSKRPERFNIVLLLIAYIPVVFSSTVLFFCYNMALVPLVFIKMFFHKLTMIFVYSKHIRISRAMKFFFAVLYTAYGLPSAFVNVFKDTYYYVMHCFVMT